MRAVIYTTDFEPITVISITQWAIDYLERYGSVRLPVYQPLTSMLHSDVPPASAAQPRTVTLRLENLRFRSGGAPKPFLITEDEESALLLKAAFLPGQIGEVQNREQAMFTRGFLQALERVGHR